MSSRFNKVEIADSDLEMIAIRSQGAGGQNVNKVSSAIHLRFDIRASSLSQREKQRLFESRDSRISQDGVIVIKAQRFRTQEKNRKDAISRLKTLIGEALVEKALRRATKPSRASRKRRVDSKTHRGKTKQLRRKVEI